MIFDFIKKYRIAFSALHLAALVYSAVLCEFDKLCFVILAVSTAACTVSFYFYSKQRQGKPFLFREISLVLENLVLILWCVNGTLDAESGRKFLFMNFAFVPSMEAETYFAVKFNITGMIGKPETWYY